MIPKNVNNYIKLFDCAFLFLAEEWIWQQILHAYSTTVCIYWFFKINSYMYTVCTCIVINSCKETSETLFFFFVVGGIWCRKFVFITLTDYYNLTHFMGTFPSPFSDHGQIHDTCTWNGQKTPSLYTAVKFTRKLVIMVLTQESVL